MSPPQCNNVNPPASHPRRPRQKAHVTAPAQQCHATSITSPQPPAKKPMSPPQRNNVTLPASHSRRPRQKAHVTAPALPPRNQLRLALFVNHPCPGAAPALKIKRHHRLLAHQHIARRLPIPILVQQRLPPKKPAVAPKTLPLPGRPAAWWAKPAPWACWPADYPARLLPPPALLWSAWLELAGPSVKSRIC